MRSTLFGSKVRITKMRVLLLVLLIILALGLGVFAQVNKVKSRIKVMFKMNRTLQEQNYYMADFEFKLLGIAYLLDKGHYRKSMAMLDQYYEQLKSRENLIKIPTFSSTEEELEFYLNLQNPKTGAFIDDAFPYCVYHAPTNNVLSHIEKLAEELSIPVKLKYRLNYLDEINSPSKLLAYLNDISTVGPIGSKLPQTNFENARELLGLARDSIKYNPRYVENLIEKHKLYYFSPEWKKTLLQWFYDFQDPETGLWGPKSKSGKLLKKDLSNTSSILKAFKDRDGNNVHEEFPLRYVDRLVASALEKLADPPPPDENLELVHGWNLDTVKSLRLMTRYLWKEMSPEDKKRAAELFTHYVILNCERYYIPEEGAFAFYPNSKHATIDGTGRFFVFQEIGALSPKRQRKLWGYPNETIQENTSLTLTQLTDDKLISIADSHGINSFRVYPVDPGTDSLISEAHFVFYPNSTPVPDIAELIPNIKHFLTTTKLSMGNWVSKASVNSRLEGVQTSERLSIARSVADIKGSSTISGGFVIIGYDVLQVPRYRITIE